MAQNKNNIPMTRVQLDSKSMLAKLMASENITVEYNGEAKTAYFDVQSRRLIMPIYPDMSEDLNDLFIGHEVGHALFTPKNTLLLQEVSSRIDPDNPQLVMGYLNILEDARIERLMKMKYPGLGRNFNQGYKDLWNSKNKNWNIDPAKIADASLIDRINLAAKFGTHVDNVNIPFTNEEAAIAERAFKTNTFDEVAQLAKEIYEYSMYNQEPPEPPPDDNGSVEEGGKGRSGSGSGSGSGKVDAESDGGGSSPNGDDGDDEGNSKTGSGNSEKENKNPSPSGGLGLGAGRNRKEIEKKEIKARTEACKARKAPPAAMTAKAFESAIADHKKASYSFIYGNVPEFITGNGVIPHKKIAEFCKNANMFSTDATTQAQIYTEWLRNDFYNTNKNYINNLVKEFEQRKAADEHKRTSVTRQGVVDIRRLAHYKTNDDIFKRVQVVHSGKNHGLFMVVDWSGSMSGCMDATIRQMLNLVMFCRKVKIPFEVYAFSDRGVWANKGSVWSKGSTTIDPTGGYGRDAFRMLQLFETSMSTVEFNTMVGYMLGVGAHFSGHRRANGLSGPVPRVRYRIPSELCLNGTPLGEAMLSMLTLVPEFQKKNKIQIVNSIILTDGEGAGLSSTVGEGYSRTNANVLRDMKTRSQVSLAPYTDDNGEYVDQFTSLARLVRARTNANLICFYLAYARNASRFIEGYMTNRTTEDVEKARKSFRDENFAIVNPKGHNDWYILPADNLSAEAEEADEKFASQSFTSAARATTALIKSQATKRISRVFLARFVDMIAKQSVGNEDIFSQKKQDKKNKVNFIHNK